MELGRLYTFAQCRALDELSIAAGVPEQQLMGQAALASLYALESAGNVRRLLILCGPGNNGGDGYALACMLAGRNPAPPAMRIFATAAPFYAELAARIARESPHIDLRIEPAESFLQITRLEPGDWIIEALLGTGQSTPPRENITALIAHINQLREIARSRCRVISLDVPVGLRENADAVGPRLMPDEIHSYGVDKLALRLDAEIAAKCRVHVLPMGFVALPDATASGSPDIRPLTYTNGARDRLRALFDKSPLHHKYSAGHGLLLGGSPGMEGAVLMAARAFFAAGGGILHAVVPDARSREFLSAALPGVMFLDHSAPLPETLRPAAILAGPGLAAQDLRPTIDLLRPVLHRYVSTNANARPDNLPWLVLDAGALPFANDPDFPEGFRARTLLTPHTGEWTKHLGGERIACVDDLLRALKFHTTKPAAYCLIKDAVSILFGPHATSPVGVRSMPNAALAVAGSGDNLAGILLAQFARRRSEHSNAEAGAFEWIAAALELLDAAARQAHHPRADQFAELIERVLGDGAPTPEPAQGTIS